ncbi:MAG: MarR family winged helix-turn-helix transcriptional regulator [Lachnospiraceae bacterium]|jgi:MarR family transcriptional repressor of mepA
MTVIRQETSIGPMMKKISERVETAVNEHVKRYHLTLSQAKIILFLANREGKSATQKDIENFLQVSHPTTVTIVNSMAAKGMIAVKGDPHDRRMKVIELTWGDENVYEELRQNAASMETALLKGFTPEEKDAVLGYLRRIYENSAEMPGEGPDAEAVKTPENG